MNWTHILVHLNDKTCDVSVYDDEGSVAYIGTLNLYFDGQTAFQGNTRKLKVVVHEDIIRDITRNCTTCDVGASTPIFVL